MPRIRFGRCNEQVSRVAVGTWAYGGECKAGKIPIGWGGHDDDDAVAALIRGYEAGINHWDTADGYGAGRSEQLIGSVWDRVPRDNIFLATKAGWVQGPYPHFYHPAQIRNQVETSLRNLRVDCIDLFYLHHCDFGPDDRHLEPALEEVRRLQKEGKFRFLGLSDWSSDKILRLCPRVDPDVVQPYRNVVDNQYVTSGLADWVDTHDLGVAFFSPLRHGLLLGKYQTPPEFGGGDMRAKIPEFRDQAWLNQIREAASAIEERIDHPQPVLHALVGVLLRDSPTASVLLGQRNQHQAEAATRLGEPVDQETAAWIRSLYVRPS